MNDAVTGNLPSSTITTVGSLSAWVKFNDPSPSDQPILAARSGGNWFGVAGYYTNIAGEIYGSSDGSTCSGATVTCSAEAGQTCSIASLAGKWSHVAMTFDNSVHLAKFYVNGVYVGSRTWYSCNIGASQTFQIAGGLGVYFNGEIDEVKIHSKAVGDVNVQPSSSGLIVNYPGAEGKHIIRVGTSSGVTETGVACN